MCVCVCVFLNACQPAVDAIALGFFCLLISASLHYCKDNYVDAFDDVGRKRLCVHVNTKRPIATLNG